MPAKACAKQLVIKSWFWRMCLDFHSTSLYRMFDKGKTRRKRNEAESSINIKH